MTRLDLLFAAALLPACAGEPLDASGTWDLQITTGATGTCFNPNQVFTTTVGAEFNGDTYVFTPSNPEPGDTVSGSFECGEECDFDLTLGEVVMTGTGNVNLTTLLELHIDDELAISGTGNVTGTGAVTCSHPITVGGTVR